MVDSYERFAEGLAECRDPVEKLAMYVRLSVYLVLLQSTLAEPVPQYLQVSLTVEALSTRTLLFELEPDQMRRYY